MFEAHRQFITSCVEPLEEHTWMQSQAEASAEAGTIEGGQLSEYVKGLEALLRERQAKVATLQAQLSTFRHSL